MERQKTGKKFWEDLGDFLYWDEDGINHVTIITKIQGKELLYAGNTNPWAARPVSLGFERYLNTPGSKPVLYIIPLKDSVFTGCNSTK